MAVNTLLTVLDLNVCAAASGSARCRVGETEVIVALYVLAYVFLA